MREAYSAWAARWRVPVGFLLTAAYFYFARPTPFWLGVSAVIAAVGILIRAGAAGHLRKGETLARGGPYAYVRHPLYLGSTFLVVGFALAGGLLWLGALFLAAFVLIYVPVVRREETEMRTRFPAEYATYAAAVPLLFPRARSARLGRAAEHFDWRLYRRNREFNALAGYLGMLLLLYLKMRYRF